MTGRTDLAIKNSVNNFNYAREYYDKVVETFNIISKSSDDEKYILIDKLSNYVKELSKYTNKIVITVLEHGNFSKETIREVISNIEKFRDAISYTEKFLVGKRLLDASIFNIEVLVEKSNFARYDYMRLAKNEKDLARKIAVILIDPNHVMTYKPILSKIANGKMTVEEFKKLYDSIKGKMPFIQNESFTSFTSFKKSNYYDV